MIAEGVLCLDMPPTVGCVGNLDRDITPLFGLPFNPALDAKGKRRDHWRNKL